jgi:hypothetical protein
LVVQWEKGSTRISKVIKWLLGMACLRFLQALIRG